MYRRWHKVAFNNKHKQIRNHYVKKLRKAFLCKLLEEMWSNNL